MIRFAFNIRKVNRRIFIEKSSGATLGAMALPNLVLMLDGCSTIPKSLNRNPEQSEIVEKINWREMMKDHDLIWKKVPSDMTEAPHFGNGLIGSMVWVEENSIRLQVFRSDVHDHADQTYGWTAYSRPRYQIGYFLLKPKGKIINCDLRQEIYHAELTGNLFTTLGSLKIEHFVHKHDDVIYTRIEATGEEEVSGWDWHPFEAKGSRSGDPGSKSYGQTYAPYKKLENPKHKILNHNEISVSIQDLAAGGNYATAWKVDQVNKNRISLMLTIQNSYPKKISADEAVRIIRITQKKVESDLRQWREEHYSWWQNYYPESFVTFPDSVGQTFYWNNVYRMACCTWYSCQSSDLYWVITA
jgi:alpha-L-fucosidase 2